MPNDNQEKTKELYDLNDLNNQIFEVDNTQALEEPPINEPTNKDFFEPPKKKKLKEKIQEWWKKLNKTQKGLCLGGLIIFLIAIGVSIFFLVKLLKKEEVVEPPVEVIVQEENYRYENGQLIFLNSNKEEIGSYTCKNQNENLCFVSYYSNEDAFDVEKKLTENGEEVSIRSAIINDNYVFINDNSKDTDTTIELYNIQEGKVEDIYTSVKKINSNRIILKNTEGKYGVLEFTNTGINPKINFLFDYLGYINENYISIQNGRNIIVDENGQNISKAIPGQIKNLNTTYVKVKLDTDKYEVYNYNAQNIFNESFDYVELYTDYAVLINDNKLYLKYYDQNKLNEEAIILDNRNYIKTNIYDENNKLITTKSSFSIEENNNIITITIIKNTDTTTTTINKAEASFSKTLKNINYFDGKLYIYKDNTKTDLLGTYTCANKNNITSNTAILQNCFLAKDTVFEDNDYEIPGVVGSIPVFNERFIFINDNPDLVNDSNKTIVLYDLKKGSVLGKYAEVNTYSYTGTNEISYATVNDLQVVAKNKSGKFGVIKIGLSEVTGHISFNYSEMESLRDYYVAKDANGYLLLSKNNGSSITSAIPYKIRNYNDNYVKVINNGNYYIYDHKGKQITTDGFRYIELYDAFFAGVKNSNKLELYMYDRPSNNILHNDIQLSLTNYYGNGTLAFKVNTTGLHYEVFMGTEANTYISVTSGDIEIDED